MKTALLAFSLLSFSALAGSTLKVTSPKENGLNFLAATAAEIGQNLDKQTTQERAKEVCKYLGYPKLKSVTSKVILSDHLKVNDVQKGNLVTLNMTRAYSSGYSNHHAVIDKLHCSK